ncbi:shikimate kinase [Halalkalibacter urbisdiaboli]|uniref:shikimate kinase n=1 Tax=Halalkalibacter urbisdiaboli TaxID=1960589 RepID=UPI001FD8E946|nr:shikimate kinase [Halalkalibacter urbisdiaboli]
MIYLTGFMGSGKTTIGQALGKALGYQVVDTDQWIENEEQVQIRELFQEKGEQYFRDLETKALQELKEKPLLVTTGGGIVIRKENREIMDERGTVVYLHCEIDEIIRRTEGDESRPLLQNKNKQAVLELFQQRLPLYKQADIIIDTTEKTVMQIVQELKGLLLKA